MQAFPLTATRTSLAPSLTVLRLPAAPVPQWRLWVTSLAGKPLSRPAPIHASSGLHAKVSADGQWLAYASDETGTSQIHVEPFGAAQQRGQQRLQASSRGGSFPRWRRDDQELFYVGADGQLMSVPVRHGISGLELGALSRGHHLGNRNRRRIAGEYGLFFDYGIE